MVSRISFDRFTDHQIKSKLNESFRLSSFDLLRLASHCKDYSYREEMEWRLALPRPKAKLMSHYEVLGKDETPYIAFDLFRDGDRLPIKRVMTGYKCLDFAAVQKVVAENGFDIPVSRSAIPYRNR